MTNRGGGEGDKRIVNKSGGSQVNVAPCTYYHETNRLIVLKSELRVRVLCITCKTLKQQISPHTWKLLGAVVLTCVSAASVNGVWVLAATHASAKVSIADWKSIAMGRKKELMECLHLPRGRVRLP